MDIFNARCPKCGRTDEIDVMTSAWMRLTKDGTDATCAETDVEDYGPKSLTHCCACGHSGRLSSFGG